MAPIPFTTSSGLSAFALPAQPIHKNWITGTFYRSYMWKHKRTDPEYIDAKIKEFLSKFPTIVLESEEIPHKASSIGWICGDLSNLVYIYVAPVFREAKIASDMLDLVCTSPEVNVHFMTPAGRKLLEAYKLVHTVRFIYP